MDEEPLHRDSFCGRDSKALLLWFLFLLGAMESAWSAPRYIPEGAQDGNLNPGCDETTISAGPGTEKIHLDRDEKGRGVFVSPPGKMEMTVKYCGAVSPGYILALYDDLYEGINLSVRLNPAGNGLYHGSLDLKPSPATSDPSGKEKENYDPRDYRFKRLEFFNEVCSQGWIRSGDLTEVMWERCVDKQAQDGGWRVRSDNGQREVYLWGENAGEFRELYGSEGGVRVWLNGVQDLIGSRDLDVTVKATSLTKRTVKVSDAEGNWRSVPALQGLKVSWQGQETVLSEGQNPVLKTGNGPMKILWKISDPNKDVQPMAFHIALFRPLESGQSASDAGGEYDFLDLSPPGTFWSKEDWQEWTVNGNDFTSVGTGRKVPPGFKAGIYQLKIVVTDFSDNSIVKTFTFSIEDANGSNSLSNPGPGNGSGSPVQAEPTPPVAHIASVAQKAGDYKTYDRNGLWVLLDQGKTDPVPARVDLSVSLSPGGPWKLVTKSVLEDPPPKDPWIWNEFLGEEEWLNAIKTGSKFIPFNIGVQKIKDILGISQFPGQGDQAVIYLKARSRDDSGNDFTGPAQPFTIVVNRIPPEISLSSDSFTVIDFDGKGGAVSGRVLNGNGENWPLRLQLVFNDSMVQEAWTNPILGGEFSFGIPSKMQGLMPNGIYSMALTARDVDGNESSQTVSMNLNVKPLQTEIPYHLRLNTARDKGSGARTALLDIPIVPNSEVSLRVAGARLLDRFAVGAVTRLQKSLELPPSLNLFQDYPSVLEIYKNGRSVSKLFTLFLAGEDGSGPDPPSTSFDGRYFFSFPGGETSSGEVSVSYDGRNSIPLAGRMALKDAPGIVEIIGFKDRIAAQTDARGLWRTWIPAELVNQGEDSQALIEITGKNGKLSTFTLNIVRNAGLAETRQGRGPDPGKALPVPTLRIASKAGRDVILEGETGDRNPVSIMITDAGGKSYGETSAFFQDGGSKGRWGKKMEGLAPGDYELYAIAEDQAGGRSTKAGPVKFTIYKSGPKPHLTDFSGGKGTYTESSRPRISGDSGLPGAQVQIYETENYIGTALSDLQGEFSFVPGEDLANGWKNFKAVVFSPDGEREESDLLSVYLSVQGSPTMERLAVIPSPGTTLERQNISVLVATKEGAPVAGARVSFSGQEGVTNKVGRIDLISPSLDGKAVLTLPVQAIRILPDGTRLEGTGSVTVRAGDAWDIRFSPNGDGIDDFAVFSPEDSPVRIMRWRGDEVVKTVTSSDLFRWDGRKEDGTPCEQGIYLARTNRGRKLVISLYR